MAYRAPVSDILRTLNHAVGLQAGIEAGIYADLADGFAETILNEAGKYGEAVLAPINTIGDRQGAVLQGSSVTTADGWKPAYRQWIEGGWNSLTGPAAHGGQRLPHLLHIACLEIWSGANMSFTLCPVLNAGAIEALEAHASPELKAVYLAKMVSGEWTGTMNLTEPQAGSDLSQVRSTARPAGDGSYRINGQKIYISYGEHDMAENIVHLVLARLPGSPPGTRGISLFLVPKYLVKADGALGARNDLRCSGIEHKMGIKASPTCTMAFGDGEGAIGWLVGEENRGLACMFTMMNNARLATAIQGVGQAEAATQKALAFAAERKQGKASGVNGVSSPIIDHPDVQRNLLQMRGLTQAGRAICLLTADATDRAARSQDAMLREQASERSALLTPIAKAFASDIGVEVASLGIQEHGGMGFIEETGAAQYLRDARIVPIYEGTNGIQAIDLVQRKISLSGGQAVAREIADMRGTLVQLSGSNAPEFGQMAGRLGEAVDGLERATAFMLAHLGSQPDVALAGATPYLRLFALARGGVSLAAMAICAQKSSGAQSTGDSGQIAVARFFAENIACAAHGLELNVTEGAGFLSDAALALSAQGIC